MKYNKKKTIDCNEYERLMSLEEDLDEEMGLLCEKHLEICEKHSAEMKKIDNLVFLTVSDKGLPELGIPSHKEWCEETRGKILDSFLENKTGEKVIEKPPFLLYHIKRILLLKPAWVVSLFIALLGGIILSVLLVRDSVLLVRDGSTISFQKIEGKENLYHVTLKKELGISPDNSILAVGFKRKSSLKASFGIPLAYAEEPKKEFEFIGVAKLVSPPSIKKPLEIEIVTLESGKQDYLLTKDVTLMNRDEGREKMDKFRDFFDPIKSQGESRVQLSKRGLGVFVILDDIGNTIMEYSLYKIFRKKSPQIGSQYIETSLAITQGCGAPLKHPMHPQVKAACFAFYIEGDLPKNGDIAVFQEQLAKTTFNKPGIAITEPLSNNTTQYYKIVKKIGSYPTYPLDLRENYLSLAANLVYYKSIEWQLTIIERGKIMIELAHTKKDPQQQLAFYETGFRNCFNAYIVTPRGTSLECMESAIKWISTIDEGKGKLYKLELETAKSQNGF